MELFSSAVVVLSSLALSVHAKHKPNQAARNTLNILIYTPEQSKVMNRICGILPGAIAEGAWSEQEVRPRNTWDPFEVTPKLVDWLEDHSSTFCIGIYFRFSIYRCLC